MDWDFTGVEEVQGLENIPAGIYLCRIEEVRPRQTADENELWGIRLVVDEGPYENRFAAWDNLVWSPRAIGRVKKVLRLLGFSVEGPLKVEPKELEGKRIVASVAPQPYRDPVSGSNVIRNRVPYDGYLEPGNNGNGRGGGEGDENLPF